MNPARHSTRAASRRRRILPWLALIAPACFALLWGVGWLLAPAPAQRNAVQRVLALHESLQPEGENAWPIYRSLFRDHLGLTRSDAPPSELRKILFANLRDLPGAEGLPLASVPDARFSDLHTLDWGAPGVAHALALLPRFEPLLTDLDRAAQAPRFLGSMSWEPGVALWDDIEKPAQPFDILLPHLGEMRLLGLVNAAFLRHAANEGDWPGVVQRVRTSVAMANHLRLDPVLISHLVSSDISKAVAEQVWRAVTEHDIPAHACDELIDALLACQTMTREHADALFEAERIGGLCYAKDIYSGKGEFDSALEGLLRARLSLPPPRLGARQIDRWYTEAGAWWSDADWASKPLPAPQGAANLCAFDLASARGRVDDAERAVDAAILRIRIERFEREHGRFPTGPEEAGLTPDDTRLLHDRGFAMPEAGAAESK